jgi:hypothetical protein
MKTPVVNLTIRITAEQSAALSAKAKANERSLSAEVRVALAKHLGK